MSRYLPDALAFIAQGALKGEKTLVHCNAGISRSGSVVVEFIRRAVPVKLVDAYAAAISARPIVRPNSNFLKQLSETQDDEFI